MNWSVRLRRKLPRRTLLIGFALLGVMLGIAFSRLDGMWLFLIIVLVFTTLIGFRLPTLFCISAAVLGMMLGYARGMIFAASVDRYSGHYEQIVKVVGRIDDDIGITASGEKEFHITDIVMDSGETLPGKIRVRFRGETKLGRGDIVQVEARLSKTLGTSRQGALTNARLRLIDSNTSIIESLRSKFFETISQVIAEPHASLGLGYLVGLRVSIPDDLNEKLSRTGLTHIVAVSGYNLTVIVSACRRLLSKRSAYQATVLPMLLIVGFILIAGWSAPIARAAVISSLSLLAWYYGRTISPILLLLISGAVTGFITPFYIWGDVSWYLSFLAFFGVLVFAPLITRRFYKDKQPNTAMQILIETISAQLFAIPYIMMLFGAVSVIAPVANLLVLPPTPLIMLGVFMAGVLGMVVPAAGQLLAIFPYLLLTLQLWVVDRLSSISWASYDIKVSATTMVGLYAVLLIVTVALHRREKRRISEIRPSAEINWNMV